MQPGEGAEPLGEEGAALASLAQPLAGGRSPSGGGLPTLQELIWGLLARGCSPGGRPLGTALKLICLWKGGTGWRGWGAATAADLSSLCRAAQRPQAESRKESRGRSRESSGGEPVAGKGPVPGLIQRRPAPGARRCGCAGTQVPGCGSPARGGWLCLSPSRLLRNPGISSKGRVAAGLPPCLAPPGSGRQPLGQNPTGSPEAVNSWRGDLRRPGLDRLRPARAGPRGAPQAAEAKLSGRSGRRLLWQNTQPGDHFPGLPHC